MSGRGWIVLGVVAVTGGWGFGCYGPAALPPRAAIAPNWPAPRPAVPFGGAQSQPAPAAVDPPAVTTTPSQPDHTAFPPLSAASWKPQAAARDWKHIVLHHTASDRGSVESIHETHLQRKDGSGKPWKGIGYHFVVGNGRGMPDGAVEPTFRWREQLDGAHAGAAEYNQYGIGIALVGNFDEEPPTSAQLAAVKQLVAALKAEYGIAGRNVIGHSDVKATDCPGKYFPLAEVCGSRFDALSSR